MDLLCKLFGHRPDPHHYLEIHQGGIDNIGRIHSRLTTVCVRCKARFRIGNLHMNDRRITEALVKYDGYVKERR